MASAHDHHITRPTYMIAISLALAVLCALAYYNAGELPFLNWDDQVYVTDNEPVKRGLTWEGFRWAWTTEQAHNRHPLTWLSHMIDCEVFGSDDARGHHLMNIALHAANAVLLFVVMARMTGQHWPAALVAALFSVHPLNVESVAWVAERKNVLSTLFWLLTMLAYSEYVRKPSWTRYTAVFLALSLGLMAKQMLVTLPCVLLLLDDWPLNRLYGTELFSGRLRPAWIVRVIEKLPLAALSLAASIIVLNVQALAKATWDDLPLSYRLANAAVSYVGYLSHALWPVNLSAHYLHPRGEISPLMVVGSILGLLAISWAVLFPLRKYRYLTIGWLWYLGTLAPVIGIVQVGEQAMADRYTYIPLIGIWMMVAYGAVDLVRWRPTLRIGLASSAIVLLLALTVATQQQVQIWRGTLPLWQRALEIDEENYRAHVELALALEGEGRLEEALPHYKRAAQLEPQRIELHTTLAKKLILTGHITAAEAALEMALQLDPQSVAAHYWLGVLRIREGQPAAGVTQLQSALRYSRDGTSQLIQSDIAEPDILYNLAAGLLETDQYEAAIEALEIASKLAPEDTETRKALAIAHFGQAKRQLSMNQPADAVVQLRAALQAQPGWMEPTFSLALVLATNSDDTIRDGEEAVQLATQVCQATGFDDPLALALLAAAYAENGDFNRAIEAASKSLALAKQREQADMVNRIEEELELYRRGQSLRGGIIE